MDAALVNADILEEKLSFLKCQKTAFTKNWFRKEYLGVSCCEKEVAFKQREYTLLIDLLTYYQSHDFTPVLSECPNCNNISTNCSSLPTILDII